MSYIENYLDVFNAREVAVIFWLLLLFAWAISKKKIIDSIRRVIKTFLSFKILLILISAIIYVGLVVFVLSKLGIWRTTLIKDTIYWIVGTAFVLLMNVNKATEDKHYFIKLLKENLKLILVVEFILNIYSFNLLIEMILIPLLFVIIAISAYVERKKEYLHVKKMTDFILSIISIIIILYAFIKIIGNYQSFLSSENLRAFVLPPLLTFAYIPFLYLLALLFTYENLFFRIGYFIKDNQAPNKNVKWKIFRLCCLNLCKLKRFSRYISPKLVINSKEEDVMKLIGSFRTGQ